MVWVGVAYPIWQEVDLKASDVMEQATARANGSVQYLLERAQQEGFPADMLLSGASRRLIITFARNCIDIFTARSK
jgi:hypothetical protein